MGGVNKTFRKSVTNKKGALVFEYKEEYGSVSIQGHFLYVSFIFVMHKILAWLILVKSLVAWH